MELGGAIRRAIVAGVELPLVLVVDNDPGLLRMIQLALKSEYRIASAASGDDGLAQAVALQPDLIVSDGWMECYTGQGLLGAVRSHPELGDVPFVLLTTQADKAVDAEALIEGAQDYLHKPFSIAELRIRVALQVMLKRLREPLHAALVV